MKKKKSNNKPDEIKFIGGAGFCWEFDSDETESVREEAYGSFLANVYEYKKELYEPHMKDEKKEINFFPKDLI